MSTISRRRGFCVNRPRDGSEPSYQSNTRWWHRFQRLRLSGTHIWRLWSSLTTFEQPNPTWWALLWFTRGQPIGGGDEKFAKGRETPGTQSIRPTVESKETTNWTVGCWGSSRWPSESGRQWRWSGGTTTEFRRGHRHRRRSRGRAESTRRWEDSRATSQSWSRRSSNYGTQAAASCHRAVPFIAMVEGRGLVMPTVATKSAPRPHCLSPPNSAFRLLWLRRKIRRKNGEGEE